jgi:uncharacterized membrane protein YgcG
MKRLLLLLFVLNTIAAYADERILDFHSEIRVQVDGNMEVSETIRVRAEGRAIKRGIFRDFPTDYRDDQGNRYRVAFDLQAVQRDGLGEDYHTERLDNGVRVYIGNANIRLVPGDYTYTIVYRTSRQLGFFGDHDELYWNVTGNGWDFPIEHASARIQLPAGMEKDQIKAEAYTGPSGARGEDYRADTLEAGAYFETNRPLDAREGLTVVVSWPKGFVHEPSRQQRLSWLLEDNRDVAAGLVGLLLLAGFYLSVWFRVGRDPETGLVIPQYEPPAGFSPAAARYISRMGHDDKTFTAALVSLAVKGYITLEQNDDEYTAIRSGQPLGGDLGPGEKRLLTSLFDGRRLKAVSFKQKNHARIRAAIEANKNALVNNYDKVYFLTNTIWLIPGILITLVTLIACIVMSGNEEAFAGAFMLVWLSGWSVGVLFLARMVYSAWRSADSAIGYGSAIGSTLFALPFFIGELAGIGMLIFVTSLSMLVILLLLLGMNALFYQLLKAPTRAGRAVLDKLEGLRLYLEVAEKDELQFKHPPEKTPELFERLFPYALALDVEQRWAERFSAVFAKLESDRQPYTPGWYQGRSFNGLAIAGFAHSMGDSLSGAIASSSTAPGSRSGSSSFGGGGSSGGGGGGGGGGGW